MSANETMAERVWVLLYRNSNDENDNGVLGIYASEQLARDAAIEKSGAKEDPRLVGLIGEGLYGGWDYLCRVEEWEVLG